MQISFFIPKMVNQVKPGQRFDLRGLLNDRERGVIKTLSKLYQQKFGKAAKDDRNLFIFVGDSATRKCWSGCSGRLPTFRRNGGKHWGVAHGRWLTPREKMATLGFPVSQQQCIAMGVPLLGISDTQRAAHIAGNSMNFSSVGVIELIALSCFKLLQ